MIRYDLKCADGHGFEAWFRNSAAFDTQAAAGAVSCPTCGSKAVEKAIMAPRIGKAASAPVSEAEQPEQGSGAAASKSPPTDKNVPAPASDNTSSTMAISGQLREALHEMKRFVEANAENVGDKFADEARKIHNGDAEERNIYGETTPDEAEALEEEGVPFGRIPWPKTNDS